MFGKNEIAPALNNPDILQVKEIFSTLQGEGPWSGYPAVFIRLAGCNLRCFFCDTNFENGTSMSPYAVLEAVQKEYNRTKRPNALVQKRVILTGGEPARQNCSGLLRLLHSEDYLVQIETAGTYAPDWFSKLNAIVVSPKTKHVHDRFYNPDIVDITDIDWKYVIRAGEVSAEDGLPTVCTQVSNPDDPTISANQLKVLEDKYGVPARPPKYARVWLSPMNEYDEAKNLANRLAVADSCMKFGYRAMVQLHNLLQLP